MTRVQFYSQLDAIKLTIDSCVRLLDKEVEASPQIRSEAEKLITRALGTINKIFIEAEYENIRNEED